MGDEVGMSFEATRSAWLETGLTALQRLVLLALADHADRENKCWPSQKRLAERTSLSERSVRKILKELEEAGRIVRQRRDRNDGGRKSDLIRLVLKGSNQSGTTASITVPEQLVELLNLPASGAADQRHEVPVPPGTGCRESYQKKLEPVRENILWGGDLLIEAFPVPDGSHLVHDRAVDCFATISPYLTRFVEPTAPGINNATLFKEWLARFDVNFVMAQILLVAARKAENSDTTRIQSWSYFEAEIERAANSDPDLARQDDGRWQLLVERFTEAE